jgi:DNA polymerase I-like protein with 3'-5' exonuclease and polymerase domains
MAETAAIVATAELRTPPVENVVYDLGRAGRITLPLYYVTDDRELWHVDEWLVKQKRYLIDTETSGVDPLKDSLATIQFGQPYCDEPRAYVIDVRCVSDAAMRSLLLKHMPDRRAKKLGQNVRFECKFITKRYNVALRGLEDTQVAEQVLRCGLFAAQGGGSDGEDEGSGRAAYKHSSMAALCRFYLGIEPDKDFKLRTSFFSTPPGKHDLRQRTYAAGDVVYPAAIARYQADELKARDLLSIAKVEWECIPVLGEAELHGMAMDAPTWRALWQQAVTKLDEAQRKLDALFLTVQGDLFSGFDPNVRPQYYAGAKPKPMNYGSAEHNKWMLVQYCKAINWPVEIITTYAQLNKRKLQYGREWLERSQSRWDERARKDQPNERPRPTEMDIPDWVLPEDQYCILLNAEKPTLIVAECLKQLPRELVDLMLEYSMYNKLASTYGITFINKNIRPETGRFHTEFHQLITNTGRLSCQPNSMNLPQNKAYRACFVAAPGKRLVIADYSQVEPRITAFVSNDAVYVATYQNKDDIYLTSAEAILGERPEKGTPEGDLQRQHSKQRVLSLAYRMGKQKFRARLIIALRKQILSGELPVPSFQETSAMYDRFFEVHTGLKEYQDRMSNLASPKTSTRKIWDTFLQAPVTWIDAPCGRKRFFPPDSNPFSEAPNVPPQAGSATMLKAALGLIQQEIDKRGWWGKVYMVNCIHDELVYEADDDIAQEFAYIMKEQMERAGNYYNGHVPIVAEFPKGTNGVVDYWMKEKEVQHDDDDAEVLAT